MVMRSKYDFHLFEGLPNSLVVVRVVELGPLMLVVIVTTSERTKCCALVYMALVMGDMYWRRNGALLHMCLLQSGTH